MVDKKISELTVATALTGVELAGYASTDNVRVPASLFNPAQHSVAVSNFGSQTIAPGAPFKKVTILSAVDWNPNGYWDVTNQRFQPQEEGLYLVSAKVTLSNLDDGQRMVIFCYKNGSEYAMFGRGTSGAGGQAAGYDGTLLIPMNGTTDYLELYVFHANAADTDIDSSTRYTTFCAVFVGAST
jgi:hypothetical protein